jgi:hypothetical protein
MYSSGTGGQDKMQFKAESGSTIKKDKVMYNGEGGSAHIYWAVTLETAD